MTLSFVVLFSSGIFYFAAFMLHLLSFLGVREVSNRPGFALMRVGFLLATFFFVSEATTRGSFLPVLNFSHAIAFFAWSIAFVYLIFLVRIQTESFGLVLTPILFLLTLVGALTLSSVETVSESVKALQANPYFKLHILSAFFAYASFTLSFSAGILYLIQQRELKSKHAGTFYQKLPSLEELEKLIYQPLFWGVPLLAATIGVGFLWSKSVYGEYWVFDPKTIATALTAILYLAILYLRYISSVRGKQGAVMSLIAFSFVLFSFVGTRFIEGSHNYLQ